MNFFFLYCGVAGSSLCLIALFSESDPEDCRLSIDPPREDARLNDTQAGSRKKSFADAVVMSGGSGENHERSRLTLDSSTRITQVTCDSHPVTHFPFIESIVIMGDMRATKRRKNENTAQPTNATAVSGRMWKAGVAITVGIGAAAFILSFIALRDLCIQAGQPSEIAFLFPVIVDGTILQATLGVVSRRHDERARRFFWKILIGAAVVSIAGNAIHAVLTTTPGFNAVLAAVIATLPPISLLASTHALVVLGDPNLVPAETHHASTTAVGSHRESANNDATTPEPLAETGDKNRTIAESMIETPAETSSRTAAAGTLTRQLEMPLVDPLETHRDTAPIPVFHSHEDRRTWALARRAAGVEVPAIAHEVDRSIATVYRWLSEAQDPITV